MRWNVLPVAASLVLVLAAALVEPAAVPFGGDRCRAAERFDGPEMARQVFFAVTEGLYRDGVSQEVAARLAEVDAEGWPLHFVSGCPVCMPAFNAVRCYVERPPFVGMKLAGDSFGEGLPPDLEQRLTHGEQKARLDALHGLVRTWVARRMADLRLTDIEREIWTEQLAAMRKQGMSSLQSWQQGSQGAKPAAYLAMKGCAVCDGASDACGGGR